MLDKKAALVMFCAVFFISCSQQIKLPAGSLAEIGEADPVVAGLTAVNAEKMRWEFYDTQKNAVRHAPLPGGTKKFLSFDDFYPSGFYVEITGNDGLKRRVAPGSMGEIVYSPDGRYLCFNMRLGSSPNTTAAIMDVRINSVIFSFGLEDRKPVANARNYGIAMERVYRRMRISGSADYFSCSEFGSGTRFVCIYSFDDKKRIKEIEHADLGVFENDDFFYLDYSVTPVALMKTAPPYKTTEKLGGIDGRAIDVSAGKGRVFITTSDYIYMYVVKDRELRRVVDMKETGKGFEIFEVVTSDTAISDDGSASLFLTVKRYLADEYSWRIYGGRF